MPYQSSYDHPATPMKIFSSRAGFVMCSVTEINREASLNCSSHAVKLRHIRLELAHREHLRPHADLVILKLCVSRYIAAASPALTPTQKGQSNESSDYLQARHFAPARRNVGRAARSQNEFTAEELCTGLGAISRRSGVQAPRAGVQL